MSNWRPLEWAVAAVVALAIAVTVADTAADPQKAAALAVAAQSVPIS